MNATEIQLLVNSEIQRYNLRKKERQKSPAYNPKAFTFSPYHTETTYRPPIETYFGDVELDTLLRDKLPTQVFGADLIHRRDSVCLYAIGSQMHVVQQDSNTRSVYKGHTGLITDIQHLPRELASPAEDAGVRFATCDKNNKICIWGYFPRPSESEEIPKPRDPPSLFKTYATLQLPKDLSYAVKTFFVSADAGKTIRMFVLLASGQLNCYDLESNRATLSAASNRTIVTPCERAPRRLFVSEHYVVLSTRERVSGFCPYSLQPVFDIDCSHKPREGAPQASPRQNIHFVHVVDQTTIAIATDTTMQLWNVLQQRPVLVQVIRADLSGYKFQGVTPAAYSDHIRVQDQVLERLKHDFSEMVDSEAQELTRDLSAFRDRKWCFIAYPVVGGTANNISESNLAFNGLAATPTHLPLLMFHLAYGHKGWLVDYVLPYAVASAAVSFHVAPKWEPNPEGFSEYAISAMHAQYIAKMQLANSRQAAVAVEAETEYDRRRLGKDISNHEESEEMNGMSENDFVEDSESAVESTGLQLQKLEAVQEAAKASQGESMEALGRELISHEEYEALLETAGMQCDQINAMSDQLETATANLESATAEMEQKSKQSLEDTVEYIQKKFDQLQSRIKKHAAKAGEKLEETMEQSVKQSANDLTAVVEKAVHEVFHPQAGHPKESFRSKVGKEVKRIANQLVERMAHKTKEASMQAIDAEHEKLRGEIGKWKTSMSESIESMKKGISRMSFGESEPKPVSRKEPKEVFTYAKAEELIEEGDVGKALTLACETDSFGAVAFCLEKFSQSGRDKSFVLTPENLPIETAAKMLRLLAADLDDAETVDVRLEWIQSLCMSEISMRANAQLDAAKRVAMEKLGEAKAKRALSPQQMYRVKVMLNMLRTVS